MNGVEGNSLPSGLDAIVASCRKGDSVAQRALYERFHRSVYGLAVRFVGRTEAADLTQEIFLRVFAGLDSFQGTACFSTWLYRVAINECLRHRRVTQISPDRLVCDPVSREIEPFPFHRCFFQLIGDALLAQLFRECPRCSVAGPLVVLNSLSDYDQRGVFDVGISVRLDHLGSFRNRPLHCRARFTRRGFADLLENPSSRRTCPTVARSGY